MVIEIEYDSKKEIAEKLDTTLEKVNEILDSHMEEWFNTIVIPEIKRLATAMNLPKGFIDGVKFIKKSKNAGSVVNTWGSKEKPLALWFNHGTVDHWIAPVFAKVLSWISGGPVGNHASAINFRSASDYNGQRLFSKGHYVSGLQRTEAMEFGISHGKKQLISQLSKLVEEKMK